MTRKMAMTTLRFILVLFFLTFCTSNENSIKRAFVTFDAQTDILSIVAFTEEPTNYVAKAVFQNSVNQTGWAYLEVVTNSNYNSSMQAYAAGLVEGFITKELINYAYQNTAEGYCTKPYNHYCQNLHKYLTTNYEWIKDLIKANTDDPYWHTVKLFYEQLSGLEAGYKGSPGSVNYDIDVFGMMYMMQIDGDLEDLESALHKPQKSHVFGSGSCSALVKILPDHSDLFVSQDTWSGFNSMLRILKKYNFSYYMTDSSTVLVPGQVLTFSSYPGSLTSGDDYYLLSSGMVSMETTIGNSNPDLWKYVQPQFTVLEMIRSVVANRLSQSGVDWANTFSKYNSGTYNNEWMIVDYKNFKPLDKQLQYGLLTVLEQIPGTVEWSDLTSVLQSDSYFASYNVANYSSIFNASGGNELVKKYGNWFSHDYTARANIFRRDHHNVKDVDSMMKLMRYNNYQHDPLSKCNCTPPYSAENAISARCDLNPKNGTYFISALGHRAHGGTDMKLTNYKMFQSNEMITVGGPTHDDLPPFQWSKSDFDKVFKHIGHPDLFDFTPIRYDGSVPAVPYP